MRQRVVSLVIGVMASLECHPVCSNAQIANGDEFPVSVSLNRIDTPRMSPLCCTDDVSETFVPGANVPSVSAFNLALRPREYNFTELLLNERADPLINNQEPALPLALALRDMHLLQRTLEWGANPSTALFRPVSPLLVRLFDDDYIARVLTRDSRVTPLMLAVLSGQTEAVRLLLQHGADTQIHTQVFHMYPLDFAAELKSILMMQLILGCQSASDGKERHVVVSLSAQKCWFLQDGTVLFETPVSTGRAGYPTRPGEYVVTQKYPAWKSTLYKVPMPSFMRLNCGQTGLHGGYVPGVPASHGCIRLPKEMAAAFYGIIKLGDRVSVVE